MKLSSILLTNHIVLGLQSRTLRNAIPELLGRVNAKSAEITAPATAAALLRREDLGPTVLAKGIAVPHARIDSLRDFYVLFGRTAQPLEDCDSTGQRVDLIFLTLCNDRKNTLMLQTLAAIGAASQDDTLLTRIREAATREAVWRVIHDTGLSVKEGLFARDIMRPLPIVVTEQMMLRELLDQFSAAGVRYAPVCDERGRISGSVTSREIIDAGFPDYMSQLRDISFLNASESFLQFFQKEGTTQVTTIMNRRPLIVRADDPLIHVVFRMRQEDDRLAFVVDGDRCVGVVDRDDICERILRP